MKTSIQRVCIIAVLTVGLSCKDQGDVVDHVRLVEVQPSPDATGVDKASVIHILFDRGIQWTEAARIQIRYVDDTSQVNSYSGCGLVPPIADLLCVGPFIWKPGRTVEVTIPKEITDLEGNTLGQPFTYRFTTARDTVPFDLVETRPVENDTVSVSASHHLFGMLRFSDYVFLGDSVLTLVPPATLHIGGMVISDSRNGPLRSVYFSIADLQPFLTYTLTLPSSIADYEGQTLPGERRVVFHTKP